MAKTVAVLGAGSGGLVTAERLRSLLPDEDRIVLVDRSLTTSLGLSVLWVLRGWREPANVTTRIKQASLPGVELVRAEVTRIDLDLRTVRTDGPTIRYDALVIALGGELHIDGTPGLRSAIDRGTAFECFSLAGAAALRRQLETTQQGRIAVAIAGVPFKCPAAPFEAAMLAADLVRSARPRSSFQVDTFTPDPLPMAVAGPLVGEGLVDLLKQQEVGFHGGHALEAVDNRWRKLVFTDHGRVPYDVLAVVPRHRPPKVVRDLGLSPTGWIPVNAQTLETSIGGVWAVGDVTALLLPNGKPLPKAAVFAQGEAEVVANNVARYLGATAPDKPYDGLGSCYIEIGGHVAAKGEGHFFAEPAPSVTLFEPSPKFHREKRTQETAWLRRWSSPARPGRKGAPAR
jgi:sulfide:quinone oxidoreductase